MENEDSSIPQFLNSPVLPKTIGILGAGQLGKMLAEAAAKLGFQTHVFAPDSDPIAASVATHFTQADYTDLAALKKFAQSVDVITLEFENVPVAPLKEIVSFPRRRESIRLNKMDPRIKSEDDNCFICPSPSVLEITQHRVREKTLAQSLGIGTAPFMAVTSKADLMEAVEKIGAPGILKTCTLGYDGKGQWKIAAPPPVGGRLGGGHPFSGEQECPHPNPPPNGEGIYIYEGFVHFEKEISVIVARSTAGEIQCFEPVENVHKHHILHTTTAPANISDDVAEKAIGVATKLAITLNVVGLLAVELFVTKSGDVLMNEMAPRPHNSGHWTLDGCNVSQFEQAIRAATGMPLIVPKRTAEKVVMTNLIGDDVQDLEKWKDAHVHIYGKKEIRPGRKMGHVTSLSSLRA